MMATDKKVKKEKDSTPKLYFAVRIRGAPGMNRKILHTLQMLRMHRVNHGVLLWGVDSYLGMLNKCKDYISYGEIKETTLLRLIRTRGKIEGNRPLTEEHIKNLTNYKTMRDFVQALLKGEIEYKDKDVYKVKPIFRLHPPRKGHRGTIKKHYGEGGSLGFVGDYINTIINKMI